MVSLAYDLHQELSSDNYDVVGKILHENWILKKSIVGGISSNEIDDMYSLALNAGATGGKILGAGAGGFLLLYVDIEKQDSVKKALKNHYYLPFLFENNGSQIFNI